jgi:hypothetical protein
VDGLMGIDNLDALHKEHQIDDVEEFVKKQQRKGVPAHLVAKALVEDGYSKDRAQIHIGLYWEGSHEG